MLYPDPRYLSDKGDIITRYRAGRLSRFPLAPHQMQELLMPPQN
jgi:hypothetical protein